METLKTFDLRLALEQAGGSAELADELFGMLLQELPTFEQELRANHAEGDLDTLVRTVHKLNGAATYCGVPALKSAATELENGIKRGEVEHIDGRLTMLLNQMQAVQQHAHERPALATASGRS